ncbi:DUF2201 family putative metallopeptidase [Neorhodopirellula pilleata]|uniref:Uncharacterized protein n=1 Tax=Neorhodopirellula pilleata TaxID=2714738 RepID=A0A5C5ZPZ7_9BACT|nr:VWA-like domain-containing protein [Neorhodopirellula pilleata]TWT89310.1 hypothetical protein Pla100_56270 [Neorhodopirellula pilleata]
MSRVDPRQRITRVIEGWFLSEPLLFAAWTMHEIASQPQIATIRVGRGRIEYNPDFIASLTNESLRQVLTFETMRILLGHPYSRRQDDAALSYAASNLTVQECLRTKLPISRARDVLGGPEHDDQYFEYYYRELLERKQQDDPPPKDASRDQDDSQQDESGRDDTQQNDEPRSQQDTQGERESDKRTNEPTGDESDGAESSDQPNSSQTPGPRSADLESYADAGSVGLENTQAWDADDLAQEEISIAIQEASQGDRWGTLGGFAKEQLRATLRPPLDYRGVLRQFRQSVLSVDRRLTRMKPSRRYGFAQMGSRYDFTTSLLFAVDVSGSMSHEVLQMGFSIINRFFQYGVRSIDVVSFDTRVISPPMTLRRAIEHIEVTGRGGTNFQCIIDLIDGRGEYKPSTNYDGLIVFTDGQAPIPKSPTNRRVKILWLFHSEAVYDRSAEGLSKLGATAFVQPTRSSRRLNR